MPMSPLNDQTADLPPPSELDAIFSSFEAAWEKALHGRAPPTPESYIAGLHEPARSTAQQQLIMLDRRYRQRLAEISPPPEEPIDERTTAYGETNGPGDTRSPSPSANVLDFEVDSA